MRKYPVTTAFTFFIFAFLTPFGGVYLYNQMPDFMRNIHNGWWSPNGYGDIYTIWLFFLSGTGTIASIVYGIENLKRVQ